jgi:hypothetical protein
VGPGVVEKEVRPDLGLKEQSDGRPKTKSRSRNVTGQKAGVALNLGT